MSSVFAVAVLIGFIAVIMLYFVSNEKRKKRKHMNHFINRFNELEIVSHLTFSSQEVLKDVAFGLDGQHRKLLVLKGSSPSTFDNRLLDLNDVKSCSLKKQYGTIAASRKEKNLEQYLEKITLCFELKNEKELVEINFYHHVTGSIYEAREMEDKGRYWEAILSKLLKSPLKEAA